MLSHQSQISCCYTAVVMLLDNQTVKPEGKMVTNFMPLVRLLCVTKLSNAYACNIFTPLDPHFLQTRPRLHISIQSQAIRPTLSSDEATNFISVFKIKPLDPHFLRTRLRTSSQYPIAQHGRGHEFHVSNQSEPLDRKFLRTRPRASCQYLTNFMQQDLYLQAATLQDVKHFCRIKTNYLMLLHFTKLGH